MKNAETQATAQAVLDYILMNPEKHDQSLWVKDANGWAPTPEQFDSCGTTMCVAGTAAWLTRSEEDFKELVRNGYIERESTGWERAGAEALGLDYMQAAQLFFTMDNEVALDMLRAVACGDPDKFEAIHDHYVDRECED